MGKILALVFLLIVGWLFISLLDELGVTNSDKWFEFDGWSSGPSYTSSEVVVIRWNEYFTHDGENWRKYTTSPGWTYNENEDIFDNIGQVVWTQWNWVLLKIEDGSVSSSYRFKF